MIIGVGTDIVEIVRIERSLARFGDRFAGKILGADELLEFQSSHVKARFLAKRFAAKEAVSKALGTGMRQGVHFPLITVDHHVSGAPFITLKGAALACSEEKQINNWQLSISDEKHHAIAFVIAESE